MWRGKQSLAPNPKTRLRASTHGAVHFYYYRRGFLALAKGLWQQALRRCCRRGGYKVRIRKFDPYLNVDPGLRSRAASRLSSSTATTRLTRRSSSQVSTPRPGPTSTTGPAAASSAADTIAPSATRSGQEISVAHAGWSGAAFKRSAGRLVCSGLGQGRVDKVVFEVLSLSAEFSTQNSKT